MTPDVTIKPFAGLSLFGSANGAGIGAGTAIDALIGVDYILAIAFRDSLNGAISFASAAADACIGNLVCHDVAPPYIFAFASFI